MECFIYAITNIVTSRRYVGSSVDPQRRWTTHRSELRYNRHHCTYLQNSFNKYGEENFVFSIIRCLETNDRSIRSLAELEEIAKSPCFNSLRASTDLQHFECSPEVRAKLSDSVKAAHTPAVRKRKSERAKHNWQNPEVRAKRLNRTFSEKELIRRSDFMKDFWSTPYGELTKVKQKAAVQSYWENSENREKESRRRTGTKQSDETKKKKSEAHKKSWINPTEAMLTIANNTAASWTDPAIRQLRSEKMKAAWIRRKARGDKPCQPSLALKQSSAP